MNKLYFGDHLKRANTRKSCDIRESDFFMLQLIRCFNKTGKLSIAIFITFLLSWQPQRRQTVDGSWPHFLLPPGNIAETQQTKICLVTFREKSFGIPWLRDSPSLKLSILLFFVLIYLDRY